MFKYSRTRRSFGGWRFAQASPSLVVVERRCHADPPVYAARGDAVRSHAEPGLGAGQPARRNWACTSSRRWLRCRLAAGTLRFRCFAAAVTLPSVSKASTLTSKMTPSCIFLASHRRQFRTPMCGGRRAARSYPGCSILQRRGQAASPTRQQPAARRRVVPNSSTRQPRMRLAVSISPPLKRRCLAPLRLRFAAPPPQARRARLKAVSAQPGEGRVRGGRQIARLSRPRPP